jgi:hypothetical protein
LYEQASFIDTIVAYPSDHGHTYTDEEIAARVAEGTQAFPSGVYRSTMRMDGVYVFIAS